MSDYMQLTEQDTTFQLAADFINKSNHPVFLTGKAGTGKTTFLRYIKESCLKNSVIVAPTGVAAMNAGGTTIHSFFQLPFAPFVPGNKNHFSGGSTNDTHNLISHLRLTGERKEIMQQLDLLIIDEISMVRADVLDAMDAVLRHVRNMPATPFGGVQVLYIGDMYQLPPVVKQDEWQLLSGSYKGLFFFYSQVVQSQPPVYIELTKVFRQRDEDFIGLLNQVRNNEMDSRGYELLHSRYQEGFTADTREHIITLTTHNAKADIINTKALAAINDRSWSFAAVIEGTFLENAYPADEKLELKVGAQVMFIKNDTEKIRRYYNGKIGSVSKVEQDKIWVSCTSGERTQVIEIKKETWKNIKYSLNKKTGRVEEDELGSFTQYPLRLAWAITIHKSQGLTFEKAIIDAGNAFSPGQVYVALSRCTSLDGLHLLSRISLQSLQSDPAIVAFAKEQRSLADQSVLLKQASVQFGFSLVRSLFDLEKADNLFNELNSWIRGSQNFKSAYADWATSFLQQWSKLAGPAKKFHDQLLSITAMPAVDTEYLNQRLLAASAYFAEEMQRFISILLKCPVQSDNRMMAKEQDNKIQELYDIISLKQHLIDGCKADHSLENFQRLKYNFQRKPFPNSVYSGRSSYTPQDIPHPELYTSLKKLRDQLCTDLNLPVYMVCSSGSLEQMTMALPQSLHELGNISGFGKVKLKQFGKQFITIISAYCEMHSLNSNPGIFPVKRLKKDKAPAKPDTKKLSFDMFNEGNSIAQIAEKRNLSVTTIEGHLAHFVAEGLLPADTFVDKKKMEIISRAHAASGSSSLTALKELLPEISYGELRFFLAAEKFHAAANN